LGLIEIEEIVSKREMTWRKNIHFVEITLKQL